MKTKRHSRRGYLLMEAVVAGSLLTIAIVSTLSMVGSAKVDAIYANNLGVAAMLARAKADQLASANNCDPGGATNPQATFITVSANHPQFEHRWTVIAAPNTGNSVPAITVAMCDVTVDVRYPARVGSRQDRQDGTTDGQGIITYRRLYTP